jgi:hypothetical protein
MKPAKSSTKNESVEFDVEKIRRFTETELAKISQGPLPYCYQLGADTLIVGPHKIVRLDEKCWRIFKGSEQIFDFFSRKDAIFYCIAVHKNKYDLATDIQISDNLMGMLEFEAIRYRYRYKQAIEQNDSWNEALFSNKYNETMLRLEAVKKQLKKSLNLAKYIKV